MADHGLRKRTSTTSYTFSLQQSEDLEKAETFNQSYGSQLEETIDHLDENAEEAIEHGHKSKKKKKRKKKKKAKENEDVELQSYRFDGIVPTPAIYKTPPDFGASLHSADTKQSHDSFSDRVIPAAVQKQEERRGLHRQTSVVTVRLGETEDSESPEVLSPVELSQAQKDGSLTESFALTELAICTTKVRSDKTQELKVLTDSKPKADKPVGGSLPEESRAKNVDDAASRRTQSDTDVKAAAAMAVSKRVSAKAKDAKSDSASKETPPKTGGASAVPSNEEPEVMCCGVKVNPEGRFGKTLKRHNAFARCRPAGGPFPAIWRGVKRLFSKLGDKLMKNKWLFVVFIFVLLLILFLILFPVSWVRLHYHEIALKRTKSTQKIYRDEVFYTGSYVLGPNTEFVIYPRSVHIEEIKGISIFTSDRLQLNVDTVVHYFIRPEELGSLNADYGIDYEPIIKNIAFSTIKNEFIRFSLTQLLQSRAHVEAEIHKAVQRKVGGTCCMSCCNSADGCNSDRMTFLCDGCDSNLESCDQGQHVDVRHFHFGKITIPTDIYSRLLASVLADVSAETESLVREKEIIEKESERQVNEIYNQANEISGFATANATLTNWLARIEGQGVIVQNATFTGWDHMNRRLGVTEEQHKLSLFMISNLDKMENLVMAQDYSEKTNVQG